LAANTNIIAEPKLKRWNPPIIPRDVDKFDLHSTVQQCENLNLIF